MELYIVRHGETVWNAQGRLQGRADIELNENGIAVAKRLGEELRGVHFDAIYSSPLRRAYDTACFIRGAREIPIIKDERLVEFSFGEGEGKHYKEWLNDESPYRFFFTAPDKYTAPPGGEGFEQIVERTRDFIVNVIEKRASGESGATAAEENLACESRAIVEETARPTRFMIVAHGALNKAIMCHIKNHGIKDFWEGGLQKNCQASVFEYDGASWSEQRAPHFNASIQ